MVHTLLKNVIAIYSPDVLFIAVVDGHKEVASLSSPSRRISRLSWHSFWHRELERHFSFPLQLLAQNSALPVSSGLWSGKYAITCIKQRLSFLTGLLDSDNQNLWEKNWFSCNIPFVAPQYLVATKATRRPHNTMAAFFIMEVGSLNWMLDNLRF